MAQLLLPCPFCGSSDVTTGDNRTLSWANCLECHASIMRQSGKAEKAATLWNRRALDVERLVRFLVDAVAEIDLNATADDLAETYSATYYANGGTPVWLENKTRAFRAVVLTALGMEATQ